MFLPGEFRGQRSQAGYSPWGRRELDRTVRLTFTFYTEHRKVTFWVHKSESSAVLLRRLRKIIAMVFLAQQISNLG